MTRNELVEGTKKICDEYYAIQSKIDNEHAWSFYEDEIIELELRSLRFLGKFKDANPDYNYKEDFQVWNAYAILHIFYRKNLSIVDLKKCFASYYKALDCEDLNTYFKEK